MHSVVFGKLGQRKQFYQDGLLVIGVGSKVLLHSLILAFRLAICPRVECRREPVINREVRADLLPKSAVELGAAIRYNIVWPAMLAKHVLEEKAGEFWRIDIFPAG